MKQEVKLKPLERKMEKEIQIRLQDETWGVRIAKNVFELSMEQNPQLSTIAIIKTNVTKIIPLSAAALFIAAISIAGFSIQNKISDNQTKNIIAKKEQRVERVRRTPTFRGSIINDNLDNIIEVSMQMR